MSDIKPQSQASLQDQLKELIELANKNGLYDAADFLQEKIKHERMKLKKALDEALNSGDGVYRP